MLNKIINFSLHNRMLVVAIAGLLAAAGVYIATRMEVDVFPDLNAPTVVVMTEAPGMAAEEVERLVTFPIETALNGATDVRRVRSSSTTGFSVVWIEFDWSTDIYRARQIVSEKLAAVGESLPKGVGIPTLGPQSSILGELMIVGLTSDSLSMEQLRTEADWVIRPRLLALSGVAQVTVIGGDIREYQILLSPQKMKNYGVTLDEAMNAATDMTRNSSGGVLYEYSNEYIVRGMLSSSDPDRIGKAVVKTSAEGTPILFEDIADIRIGSKAPKLGVASERGKPAVLMTITKQPNTNTIELTERLDKTIAELQKSLPSGVNVSTDIFRQARFIESSIDNIQKAIMEGALFVIVVLFFFLMNTRVTIISLVALPLSLLISILVLKLFGMTLNTMSLGGMAIAIGSLVDDAIIDVENVFKRLRQNYALPAEERQNTLKVVFDASTEIRTSIVNATFITMVAFVPLFFLGGMEGRMLKPLGVAFIVSLFASLLVAITLTPVMCSYLLTSNRVLSRNIKEPFIADRLKRGYRKWLERAIGYRKMILGITGALVVVAIVLFAGMGRSFLPPFNEGSLTINTATLPGISLEESDNIGRRVEQVLLEVPEIETVARKTGRAELDEHALGVNVSELEAPFTLTKRNRAEFLADVRGRLSKLQGVNIEIGQPISHRIDAMLSGTKSNIAIKLFGTDLNRMYAVGNQIKEEISTIPELTDLNIEQQIERPQLQIVPRPQMLARYGITMPEFAEFVTVALSGQAVSQVYDNGRTFDLTLKVEDQHRNSIDRIKDLNIDTQQGPVPLSYVADVRSQSGPNAINRENVQRKLVVSANVIGGDLTGAVDKIRKAVSEKVSLPENYYVEYGGQFESQQKASRVLLFTSLLALVVIFLLLFQEFKNMSVCSMIMLNLPLALIGGVVIVFFTTRVISIPAIIGFISLLGIAVRNGILLVNHYQQLRSMGCSLRESVIEGSVDRLTPILMTSLSSALALIPLAMGGDVSGNEIQSPMAQVILGGLLSSTLLNVFVVPIVYLIINRRKDEK